MLATRGDPKSSPPARPRQSRPPLWRDPSAVRASSGWASGLPLLPQTSAAAVSNAAPSTQQNPTARENLSEFYENPDPAAARPPPARPPAVRLRSTEHQVLDSIRLQQHAEYSAASASSAAPSTQQYPAARENPKELY